jgi:hypothetical protein
MTGNELSYLCENSVRFMIHAGAGTLVAGVLLGIALAVVTLVLALRRPVPAPESVETSSAPTPTAILDSIKGFLQALSAAPTWLALVGAGILLLWLAGVQIDSCKAA